MEIPIRVRSSRTLSPCASSRGLSSAILLAVPLMVISPEPTLAQKTEADEVSQLAEEFVAALSNRDAATLDRLLAPEAMIYSVRQSEDGPLYGTRSRESFLERIGSGSSSFVERIWDPVVEVKGRVAMVWAPYDFHAGGSFSHCGIDLLTYLKLKDGWKITSLTYDVVREGCEASPLGKPGG